MDSSNSFSQHYAPLLSGEYNCIDRIVLNAYLPMLLTGGGVRVWYRAMCGSDLDMDNAAMMRFAGRFSRRVACFCQKNNISLIHSPIGERKHEEAERLIPSNPSFTGLFAVFVSRAPSLLWEVKRFENNSIDIRRKKKTSLVTHYYFHIMDREWGHLMIRMCAHPPFSCNIILNGHEWVDRHANHQKLGLIKEGNCFTGYNNGQELTQIADTLKTGQLEQVCQRWIYSCLWFVMDKSQQQATGIAYKYSVYQIEYSHNFLFQRGAVMDSVYQYIIDLTRGRLDMKRLRTIFGKAKRPYQQKKKNKSAASAPEVRVETPDYNLTIFKIHFGRLTVKLYDKGERTLRAEVVVHNTKDLQCKRGLDSFGEIIEKLETIMRSFLSNLDFAHIACIDDGAFKQIAAPAQTGSKRLAGIDFNKERTEQTAAALLCLCIKPNGFTSDDLAQIVCKRYNIPYTKRQASYDLKKFRGKKLVEKVNKKRKYVVTSKGIKIISVMLCLLKLQAPQLTPFVTSQYVNVDKEKILEFEKHLFSLHKETEYLNSMQGIFWAA